MEIKLVEKQTRLTADIPNNMHIWVKSQAAFRQQTVRDLIVDILSYAKDNEILNKIKTK